MYAIVQVGGRQYRAAVGERLVVDRLQVEPGSRLQLADVRMLVAEEGDSEPTQVGRPRLDGVSVAARAVAHLRGAKVLIFKYKPKKRYRRHQGFRAELTELRIEEVRVGDYQEEAPVETTETRPARASRRSPRAAAAAEKASPSATTTEVEAPEAETVKVTEAKAATKQPRARASKPEAAAKPTPARTRAKPKPKQEPGDGA